MEPATTSNFQQALTFALQWEGGYVNHPDDPGGATNRGVTQRVYDAYRRSRLLSVRSVRQVSEAEVREIYLNQYWATACCHLMPHPLSAVQFDTAVNFGVRRAVQFLQTALGITADGIAGPVTIGAIARADQVAIARSICQQRINYRHQRVKQQPRSQVFLKGWLNRDNALKSLVG